jgi:hypothetical protein
MVPDYSFFFFPLLYVPIRMAIFLHVLLWQVLGSVLDTLDRQACIVHGVMIDVAYDALALFIELDLC